MVAVYDEGVSSALEVCDSALDPDDITNLIVSNDSIDIGETVEITISMDNESEVAGFQFSFGIDQNIASLTSVSTTDRTSGWSVSNIDGTIVGFSLLGETISQGSGPILNITLQGQQVGQTDICLNDIILSDGESNILQVFAQCGMLSVGGEMIEGCMDVNALNYNPDANIPCDDCCQYPSDVTLNWGNVSDGSAEVIMENSLNVAGFQFTVSGATINQAYGGSSEANGFMVSVANNTLAGFSLTGTTIENGLGVLVNLEYSELIDDLCLS